MVLIPQTVRWNGWKKGGQILEGAVSLVRTEIGMEASSGRIFYIKKLPTSPTSGFPKYSQKHAQVKMHAFVGLWRDKKAFLSNQ